MSHGIIIRGTFLGYKSSEFKNNQTGEIRYRHVLGIGIQRVNEFGSISEDIQKVTIRNDDFTNELITKMNELKAKDVEINVVLNLWEVEGKSGLTITYVPQNGIRLAK